MVDVQKIIDEQNREKKTMLVTLEADIKIKIVKEEALLNTMFECYFSSPDSEDVCNIQDQRFKLRMLSLNLELVRKALEKC